MKIAHLKKEQEDQKAVFWKKEEDWREQGERVAELARNAAVKTEERVKLAAQEATEKAEQAAMAKSLAASEQQQREIKGAHAQAACKNLRFNVF